MALSQQEILEGMDRLFGDQFEARWRVLLHAHKGQLRHVVDAWPFEGQAFDIGTVLGIGLPDNGVFPTPNPCEYVLKTTIPISPRDLREHDCTAKFLHVKDRDYDNFLSNQSIVYPGTYVVRFPVPSSEGCSFCRQLDLVREQHDEYDISPLVLIELVLFCCEVLKLPDPSRGMAVRCREQAHRADHHLTVMWRRGRDGRMLSIANYADGPCDATVSSFAEWRGA